MRLASLREGSIFAEARTLPCGSRERRSSGEGASEGVVEVRCSSPGPCSCAKMALELLSMGEDVKTFSSIRRIFSVSHPASASRPPLNLHGEGFDRQRSRG